MAGWGKRWTCWNCYAEQEGTARSCADCGSSYGALSQDPLESPPRPPRAVDCTHCHGRGWSARRTQESFFSQNTRARWSPCDICGGRGWLCDGEDDLTAGFTESSAEAPDAESI